VAQIQVMYVADLRLTPLVCFHDQLLTMISVPPHTHSDLSPLVVMGFVTQVWMWFDGRVWKVDVASVLVQEEVINNPD